MVLGGSSCAIPATGVDDRPRLERGLRGVVLGNGPGVCVVGRYSRLVPSILLLIAVAAAVIVAVIVVAVLGCRAVGTDL